MPYNTLRALAQIDRVEAQVSEANQHIDHLKIQMQAAIHELTRLKQQQLEFSAFLATRGVDLSNMPLPDFSPLEAHFKTMAAEVQVLSALDHNFSELKQELSELRAPEHSILRTDLYQITMAQGYWAETIKHNVPEKITTFELFFRKNPFDGGYAMSCGLHDVIDYIKHAQFTDSDIAFLRTQTDRKKRPLFQEDFLSHLKNLRFDDCEIHAIPDGTVVFAHEPLLRLTGPTIKVQLLETALLNIMGFQTLIATKAARVKEAAGKNSVAEFGLRRAQDPGGLKASYAAALTTNSTSNVLAAKEHGINVSGTHAHSWVMNHATELEAFESYADIMPGNCVFLLDTYNVEQGTRHAIKVAKDLKAKDEALIGVRLDSGDLAEDSKMVRDMLDNAGFSDVIIIASNDLDEHLIETLKQQGACIDVYGVGTNLVTGGKQSAAGCVYKTVAVQAHPGAPLEGKMKISSNPGKTTNPYPKQVIRCYDADGQMAGDIMCSVPDIASLKALQLVNPEDETDLRDMSGFRAEYLLQPVYQNGTFCHEESLEAARARATEGLRCLPEAVKRLQNPHWYPVGLEQGLHEQKKTLMLQIRGNIAVQKADALPKTSESGLSFLASVQTQPVGGMELPEEPSESQQP